MDGEFTTRDCVELLEIRKVRHLVLVLTGWKGTARVRGHNAHERVDWYKWTMSRQYLKGSGVGQAIMLASLIIWLGRSGRLESELQALNQGNVEVEVLH